MSRLCFLLDGSFWFDLKFRFIDAGRCCNGRFKSFLEEGGRVGIYRLAGLAWPEGVKLHDFSWFLV